VSGSSATAILPEDEFLIRFWVHDAPLGKESADSLHREEFTTEGLETAESDSIYFTAAGFGTGFSDERGSTLKTNDLEAFADAFVRSAVGLDAERLRRKAFEFLERVRKDAILEAASLIERESPTCGLLPKGSLSCEKRGGVEFHAEACSAYLKGAILDLIA
jgi:hypothetical protein